MSTNTKCTYSWTIGTTKLEETVLELGSKEATKTMTFSKNSIAI